MNERGEPLPAGAQPSTVGPSDDPPCAIARPIGFLLPGDPATPTGGYRYDARVIDGLRSRGHAVRRECLSAQFPSPDDDALADADRRLASFDDGSAVIVDGLAFGAMPAVAERQARRLRLVALVHHPLALETGLTAQRTAQLLDSERRALACARAVIVTSRTTAGSLRELGLLPAAGAPPVCIAEPGVDEMPIAERGTRAGSLPQRTTDAIAAAQRGAAAASDATASSEAAAGSTIATRRAFAEAGTISRRPLALLYVAALTPRKGHLLLLDALERVLVAGHTHWHLTCAGALDRDPVTVQQMRDRLAGPPLRDRVTLAGAVDEHRLAALYREADVYLNPSLWEGYGMAAAQAVACGLPIVTTAAGALAESVPAEAALRVATGDVASLADAIGRLLGDRALRSLLAASARAAAAQLPRWPATIASIDALLRSLPAR